jgi:hypothetical protein
MLVLKVIFFNFRPNEKPLAPPARARGFNYLLPLNVKRQFIAKTAAEQVWENFG